MKSMTGYGHSVYQREDYIIECEMKGYNNRYLDIVHNISPALSPYESYIDDEIKKVASRGRVELSMKLRIIKSHAELIIDDGLLEDYKAAYSRIAEITGTSPLLSDYLALDGILTVNMVSGGDYKEGVEKVLSEALSSFLAMRISDGQGTLSDLQRLGDRFESSLKRIEENADRLENHFSELLTRKYEELTGETAAHS